MFYQYLKRVFEDLSPSLVVLMGIRNQIMILSDDYRKLPHGLCAKSPHGLSEQKL